MVDEINHMQTQSVMMLNENIQQIQRHRRMSTHLRNFSRRILTCTRWSDSTTVDY